MRIIGIHLGGLGTGTSETSGYMLCTSLPDGFDTTKEGYTWREVLPEKPNRFGGMSRVSPFQAKFRFAPIDFVTAAGHGEDWLVELLFATQQQANAELTASIGDALFLGGTSLQIDDTSPLSAGDVIYVGMETMKIDSVDSSTQITVNRGYYRSPILEHASGANIYLTPPTHRGRRVILYTYDTEDAALRARNRGQITGSVEMETSTMTVPSRQAAAVLKRAKLNTSPSVASQHDLYLREDSDEDVDYTVSGYVSGLERQIRKENASTQDTFVVVDDDKAICHLAGGEDLVRGHYLLSKHRRHRTFFTQNATEIKTDPYELFVVDKAYDDALDSVVSHTSALADVSAIAHGVKIEDSSLYPYHPLAIAAALMLSTDRPTNEPDNFDVFRAPQFGGDLSELFHDDIYAKIHTLIQKTQYWADYLEQFILGWEAEPEKLLNVIVSKLMHPYSFFFGRDKNGKLDIHHLSLTDVDSYGDAISNEIAPITGQKATYRTDNGLSETVDTITATVGDIPTEEGRTITLDAETGQPQSAYNLPVEETSLDLSTIPKSDAREEAVDLVINRALAQHYALQRLTVTCRDWAKEGLDYGIGKRVTLDDIRIIDAWLVDPVDGTRIKNVSNDVRFVGQIIEVKEDHRRGRWDLTLLLNSAELVRRRAPAGIVSSATVNASTTDITLVDPSPFDGAGILNREDADYFTVGDDLVVWQPDGDKVDSTPAEITSISSNTITVDRALSSVPQTDDIVRLAHLDTDGSGTGYVNTAIDANVALVYTFFADDTATLGDAGDDAHIYGV